MSSSIVFFGLALSSSWGNGHATTYRALVRGLAERGHAVTFLERNRPWYSANRDHADSDHCRLVFYDDVAALTNRFVDTVASADLVVIGSYVPNGPTIADFVFRHARGVTAFYDIDTPVTLAALRAGSCEYLLASDIARFDLYLSFTGGPLLDAVHTEFGARRVRALHCGVDPSIHSPLVVDPQAALGYLGTYAIDRQPALEKLLSSAAREARDLSFTIAGPGYPDVDMWPANVRHMEHVAPSEHAAFYCAHRYALNLTRADMISAGFSPSVRLFEAAACGVPVITDRWAGLESFFVPGEEILIADTTNDVLAILRGVPEARRRDIGLAGRRRVLSDHTGLARARDLERHHHDAAAARRDARISDFVG